MAATGLVSTSVIQAILSGSTRITRRAEIYEADGTTLWNDSPRVKSGEVSVDYSRVDRRNLDLTLDNSKKDIIHDPVNGLWYDKIVKVYRGITYTNLKASPSIVVLGADGNSNIAAAFRRDAFFDLTFYPSLTALPGATDLLEYDIVVGWAEDANLDTRVSNVLKAVYNTGGNVLSVCNFADSSSVPLIATSTSRSGSVLWDVNQPMFGNEFANYWSIYNASFTNGETVPMTANINAKAVATTTISGNQVPAALIQQGANGGQWFHYHPKINMNITPQLNLGMFLGLFRAGVKWLYAYGGSSEYETQVGEFCIDKIKEPRFPHEINITGRDYAKRLTLSKYSDSVTYSAGQDLYTLIVAIAANGGVFKVQVNTQGATLLSDLTFTRNTDRMTAIVQIAAGSNLEVFFNAYGVLVVRPFFDPGSSPVSLYLNLAGGPGVGNLSDLVKTSDDGNLFNRIIVTGGSASDAVSGLVYEGIAENNEPSSPTRIDRIGERTNTIDMQSFTSDAQCLAYAQSVLSVSALESYNIDFSSLCFPWLEAGEIVQYQDYLNNQDPNRYLLTSFNIPLELGSQSGTAKRVSVVG